MSSYTCLPLVFHSPNRFTCMGFLLLSKGCIPGPHDFASVFHTCLLHSGCLGPNDFTLVSHLSLTLGCLGPHEFTLVSHLSPTLVSHTCLGAHGCLHEFTLVSHLSLTLVSHSGCLGPHEFTLVSYHLSSALVFHSGCLGPHEFTLVSHLSPTLVSHTCHRTLGACMSLHLSPACLLTLWFPWAA